MRLDTIIGTAADRHFEVVIIRIDGRLELLNKKGSIRIGKLAYPITDTGTDIPCAARWIPLFRLLKNNIAVFFNFLNHLPHKLPDFFYLRKLNPRDLVTLTGG